MKVTVVGAGNVGATCADVLAYREIANEIVLVDIKEGLAEGKSLDIWQKAPIDLYDSRTVGATNDYARTANQSGQARPTNRYRYAPEADLTRTSFCATPLFQSGEPPMPAAQSPKFDKTGRPYAQLSKLKPGDILEADAGFDCMDCGAHYPVKGNCNGELYIECTSPSGHKLDGQADDGENLIGLYLVETK